MSQGNASAGISSGLDSDNVFKYRDKAMCNRWTTDYASFLMCDVKIMHNPIGNYIVNGKLKSHLSSIASNGLIKYWAANPPTHSFSYVGSRMPYPNEDVAFDNTPNQGVAEIIDGQFTLNIFYPNSYYDNLGKKYIKPRVQFKICDENNNDISSTYIINIGEGTPFRTLTWPKERDWNKGPMFYCNNNLPVRTQEQILKDSGYPTTNSTPPNFWGKDPPH